MTTYIARQDRQSRKENLLKKRIAGQHRQSRKDNLLKRRIAGQHRESRKDNLLKKRIARVSLAGVPPSLHVRQLPGHVGFQQEREPA
jgi:hypothetical protein